MELGFVEEFTGNAFIDAGAFLILEWAKKENFKAISKEELIELAEKLVNIYINESWNKTLTSIFPNAKITNPSIKDKAKDFRSRLIEFIDAMNEEQNLGNCQGCGRRDIQFYLNRSEFPLAGSNKAMNFFPSWDNGVGLCGKCSLSVQFSPLVMYRCVNFAFFHSNSSKVMQYWAKLALEKIEREILMGNYTGMNDLGYTQPINFIFKMAEEIISKYDENWQNENVFLRMYLFSNYGQSPKLNYYDMPSDIFRFLAYLKLEGLNEEWHNLINQYIKKIKKDMNKDEKELIKIRSNRLFNNLMINKSIIHLLFNMKIKKTYVSWKFLELYTKEVLHIKKERLEYIKQLADLILEILQKSNDRKRLVQIEGSRGYSQFRVALLLLAKDALRYLENPLIKFNDLTDYLFPETDYGVIWRETRDFILFRIYEQGYDFLKQYISEIAFTELEKETELKMEEI